MSRSQKNARQIPTNRPTGGSPRHLASAPENTQKSPPSQFCNLNVFTLHLKCRFTGARPHLLSDPVLTKGSRGERIQQWVQPDAFRFPAPFTFGSAPRLLPIRGDGIKNFDVSIIKFFPIRERMNVEFRAEAFNLFNRPQFGLPDMFFGGPTFGRVFFTT